VRRALIVIFVASAAVAGCAGRPLRAQTTATAALIATARASGALTCAPVELAMAEAHNEFAQHALDEGDARDAHRDAEIAETSAQLALAKSPNGTCVAQPRVTSRPDRDGDGIPDDVDQCPSLPEDRDGFQDDDGCPDVDNDNDGITDALDQCPNEPEDRDGWKDDDGCPDPDNDGDGILDTADKCPDEAGVPPDGCPRTYKLVTVTDTKIELKQTVFFETGRATIRRVSFALLNDVAQALVDNPRLAVEIQGHTDSQGNAAVNLKLSQKRADAVRTYLIKKAVGSDRLVAKGYGKTVPIADNRTSEGRAQNRRVEFVITAR